MKTRFILSTGLILAGINFSFAGPLRTSTGTPAAVDSSSPATLDQSLRGAQGQVEVVIKLADVPLALAHGANAKKTGAWLSKSAQKAYLDQLKGKQDMLSAKAVGLGGVELARMTKSLNAVVIRIDAAK